MSSGERISPMNNDSEMEEGEIVDEWDDLSDISSEEEFLLRQRLLVLENYNNALERKEAKRVSSGRIEKSTEPLLPDLSEISATELEDNTSEYVKHSKKQICSKAKHREKKINVHNGHRKNKKKHHHKRKLEPKIISESSEESDDEYRNKRRKLANAVALSKEKVDTSLKSRLGIMLCGKKSEDECLGTENIKVTNEIVHGQDTSSLDIKEKTSQEIAKEKEIVVCTQMSDEIKNDTSGNCQALNKDKDDIQIINTEEKDQCDIKLISLSTEETKKDKGSEIVDKTKNVVELHTKEVLNNKQDSDDEIELLRQYALKTKSIKKESQANETSTMVQNKPQSEDDESDTADLRLICLKSALLKKAIEMKMKQKLRKRLKSKRLQNDIVTHHEESGNITDLENNTDIESVDMDIGSDGDDKVKESNGTGNVCLERGLPNNVNNNSNTNKQDELEDDEDLLRAQLLTSLAKNLPNLIAMDDVVNSIENTKSDLNTTEKSQNISEEKKFIINLKDTDSEGENEATKNLTKMHMKLSERLDFQQKLDLFLKSTRLQVENKKLPDLIQQPPLSNPNAKYVPKAVNHLPKSEQIEYKNLVKRMAELEKMKQVRQASINQKNTNILKETINPRNITIETNNTFSNKLEEKIAISRKNIAEESARMLKLKEEATKLLQKYKIVATELRNISTAITMNKKEQRTVQSKLARIRVNHQMLLKSSNFKHSTGRIPPINQISNKVAVNKLQKENNPKKEENKSTIIKAGTVNVVNNVRKENTGPISKPIDISGNNINKTDKTPKILDKGRNVNVVEDKSHVNKNKEVMSTETTSCDKKDNEVHPDLKTNCGILEIETRSDIFIKHDERSTDASDYQSPLNALGSTIWQEDPNAVLCPYEVGGSCRDPDCKFLHPKIPSNQ